MRSSNSWEQLPKEKKEQFHALTNYKDKLNFWLDNNVDGISFFRLKDESKSDTDLENIITEATIYPKNDQEAKLYYTDYYRAHIERISPFKFSLEEKINKVEESLRLAPDKKLVIQMFMQENNDNLLIKLIETPASQKQNLSNGEQFRYKYIQMGYKAAISGKDPDITLDYIGDLLRHIREAEIFAQYSQYLKDTAQRIKNNTYESIDEDLEEERQWTLAERYYLLNCLGLDLQKIPLLNECEQKTKHTILAKLLKCNDRVARGVFNNENRYGLTPVSKQKVEEFIEREIKKGAY